MELQQVERGSETSPSVYQPVPAGPPGGVERRFDPRRYERCMIKEVMGDAAHDLPALQLGAELSINRHTHVYEANIAALIPGLSSTLHLSGAATDLRWSMAERAYQLRLVLDPDQKVRPAVRAHLRDLFSSAMRRTADRTPGADGSVRLALWLPIPFVLDGHVSGFYRSDVRRASPTAVYAFVAGTIRPPQPLCIT